MKNGDGYQGARNTRGMATDESLDKRPLSEPPVTSGGALLQALQELLRTTEDLNDAHGKIEALLFQALHVQVRLTRADLDVHVEKWRTANDLTGGSPLFERNALLALDLLVQDQDEAFEDRIAALAREGGFTPDRAREIATRELNVGAARTRRPPVSYLDVGVARTRQDRERYSGSVSSPREIAAGLRTRQEPATGEVRQLIRTLAAVEVGDIEQRIPDDGDVESRALAGMLTVFADWARTILSNDNDDDNPCDCVRGSS
jgi:hypothetical protein